MLKFSCPDFAFPMLDHQHIPGLIQAMGFDATDIALFEDRSHLQPHDQYVNPTASARALRQRLEDAGLIASDLFVQGSLDFRDGAANHYDAKKREASRTLFMNTLEYATALGACHVSALPGCDFPELESYETSYGRCVEEQSWRAEQAKKAGLPYGVEAHIGSICEHPHRAKQLCEETGIGLTMDYSHFVRVGLPEAAGDILLPYTNHFHARAANRYALQTCLQDSAIDFARVKQELEAMNYTGYVCLEYCWTPNWEDCCRNDNIGEIMILKELMSR